jgi:hypothetical protein
MLTLTYSGQQTVTQDQAQRAHELLDALLTVHGNSTPVTVDNGGIRPQGDTLLIVCTLSAQGDLGTIEAVQDELGTALVDLGLEPDTESATDAITVSG